jgi:hypothetical protein
MRLTAILLAAAGAGLAAGPALADAIDGNWCRQGRQFTIEGPKITTPAGTHTEGDYRRHSFSYDVPEGEDGAGVEIRMVLLDEETVQLSRGTAEGAPEVWHRCSITS